ncbi:MAG: shikimate dehydrogenase [Alpinimonas sp.]|jgi:shikimate dehydrogenase
MKSGWRRTLNSSNSAVDAALEPSLRRLGVVGHPIGHSLSPALHRAAYEALSLGWSYEAIDLEPGELTSFVAGLDDSWAGLSVTMPHKVEALHLATSIDLLSRATGSVNTLVFHRNSDGERRIEGYNTDVAGMVLALADAGLVSARRVAVLGGGATAASAIAASAELGAENVMVIVRSVARAEHLVDVGNALGVTVSIHDINAIADLAPVELVISTVPGDVAASLDPLARTTSAILLDVAYSPWPSVRGEEWSSRVGGSGVVVSGRAMLAHQALMQVRLFQAGDVLLELPRESVVRTAMFAAVGLS